MDMTSLNTSRTTQQTLRAHIKERRYVFRIPLNFTTDIAGKQLIL